MEVRKALSKVLQFGLDYVINAISEVAPAYENWRQQKLTIAFAPVLVLLRKVLSNC